MVRRSRALLTSGGKAVTSEKVLQSDGGERFKWMCAGRKELDNLQGTKTVAAILHQMPRRGSRLLQRQGRSTSKLPPKRSVYQASQPSNTKSGLLHVASRLMRHTGRTSRTDLGHCYDLSSDPSKEVYL